jgi:hypothetical protein
MVRALSQDEDTYPDASRFHPNRYLTDEGQMKDDITDYFAFGNGGRVIQIWCHSACACVFVLVSISTY